MTYFARTPARAAATSRTALTILALIGAALLAAVLAAPAGAVVSEEEGLQVGLQPRTTELHRPGTEFSNENGNVVVDGASVYFVYWDPGAWMHHEWVTNLDELGRDIGAGSGQDGSILAALSQYRDRSNTPAENSFVFKGAYADTAPYPTSNNCTAPPSLELAEAGELACLTDAQLREQLQSFIAAQGTPKGMHAIYYLITPPNVTVCLTKASKRCSDFSLTSKELEEGERNSTSYKNSFCSYHGAINQDKAAEGDESTILYAAIPWSAGYEGVPWDFLPVQSMRGQAYDCQDGGWNPEKYEEHYENPPGPMTAEEEKAYNEASGEGKANILKARRLKGPHVEEPKQVESREEPDYAAFLSEVESNQILEEQANIVTDPLLTSWQDPTTKFEATDECRDRFDNTDEPGRLVGAVQANENTEAGTLGNASVGGTTYYVNNVVNLGALHSGWECTNGYGLIPRFTAPNPVNAGELVDLDGMESTVTEFKRALFGPTGRPTTTWSTFTWNFGDGTTVTGYAPGSTPSCQAPWLPPCASSAFHSYTYGGTYPVTLTVTDVGGHTASVTHEITVVGPQPPPPAPPTQPGATGSGSGASPGSSSSTKTTPAPTPVPAPTAAAAISSRSLRKALKKGIVVSYTVNEQVTGHFEVLMSQTLARRLKISGPLATGLPAGTPAQVVIGRAVLVTTKGGRGVVAIKLSNKLSSRLKRAHSAQLMLRLIVHNATSPSPVSVISASTLAG